ncbi:MAG TPA: hypothetical protein VFZ65_15540 [Planctomycetota bacterium]|nr:hypothetical protein [Planctomycetota bacterium]
MTARADSKRPILAIGLLAVLVATAWIVVADPLAWRDAPSGRTTASAPDAAPVGGVVWPEVLPYQEARRSLVPVPSEGSPGSESSLLGHVLDEGTGLPVADVRVRLDLPASSEASGGVETIEAATTRSGEFRVDLPRHVISDSVCRAVVVDAVKEVLFAGQVQLTNGLVLLVPRSLALHGAVDGVADVCDRGASFVLVQELGMGRSRNLGQGTLDAQGRFQVHCRTADATLPVRVRVGCGSAIHALTTDVATLSSLEGFLGTLQTRSLVVRTVDEAGASVIGAEVGVAPPEISRNGAVVRATTDAQGLAILRVSSAPTLLVAAAATGRRQAHAAVAEESWPSELRLTLGALGPSDVLAGYVRNEHGAPHANAVVTALPTSRASLLKTLLPAQARTAEDGSFSLQVGGDVQFELTAFSKQSGMSAVVIGSPPAENLLIPLPEGRALRIHAVAPQTDAVSRGGDVQWCLMQVGTAAEIVGADSLPFTTEPIPAGEYNFAVFWQEAGLFAEASVSVTSASEPQEILVFLSEPNWFEGRVDAQRSSALRVRHKHRMWTESPVWLWSTAPCGADGSFRVLAGREQTGDLEVLDAGGTVVGRGKGRCNEPVRLAISSR